MKKLLRSVFVFVLAFSLVLGTGAFTNVGTINVNAATALKSVYLIATRDLSNLWLQFFLSQNQGFMRLFEKTVLK